MKATALWLSSWFLLVFADTRSELVSAGIQAIFPGDQAYELACRTCTTVPPVCSGNQTHLFTFYSQQAIHLSTRWHHLPKFS